MNYYGSIILRRPRVGDPIFMIPSNNISRLLLLREIRITRKVRNKEKLRRKNQVWNSLMRFHVLKSAFCLKIAIFDNNFDTIMTLSDHIFDRNLEIMNCHSFLTLGFESLDESSQILTRDDHFGCRVSQIYQNYWKKEEPIFAFEWTVN